MRRIPLRAACASAALACLLPLAVSAAPKPFVGPSSGWDHNVATTPTPQAPRALETWKKGDGEYVTYLEDAALSYDDTVSLVKKNVADNGFKATVDTDRRCDGKRAHEVEMSLGTTIVHQLIVDDAPGVTKLTYARPMNTPAAADVTSALTTYCGGS